MSIEPEASHPREPGPTPVDPPSTPPTPKVEGVRWHSSTPVVREWISPNDIKPVKGFEGWHAAFYSAGSNNEQECSIAAIDCCLVRLKITSEVSLSSSKLIVINIKQSPSDLEGRDLPFTIDRSIKITPEDTKKVIFLVHMKDLKLRPVYIKSERAGELTPLVHDVYPDTRGP